MRPICLSLLLSAGLLPVPAFAALVNRNVDAGVVAQVPVWLNEGTNYLSFGAWDWTDDPVLHVVCNGAPIASNDDYFGLNPYLSVYRGTGQWCTAIVHARTMALGGTGDLYVNGYWHSSTDFRGFSIENAYGDYNRWETVQETGGATDAILLGLDWTGNLVFVDDNSGVGLDARLPLSPSIARVVAGRVSGTTPGTIAVIGNDVGTWSLPDMDGDGLGPALEAELGTCDAFPSHPATYDCVDTDRDGLPDAAEVFGVEGTPADHLPRWGASPLHKDAFFEVDYRWDLGAVSVAPSKFDAFRAILDDAWDAEVMNPDGLDGIRLHVDLGEDSNNPADWTKYGDWGGSRHDLPSSNPLGGNVWSAAEARPSFLPVHRQGTFHYVFVGPGASGSAWGNIMNLGIDASPTTIAHEGGHAFHIHHWGHDSWGELNCKPNYNSMMNYLYQDELFRGFSHEGSSPPTNPSRADEGDGWYAMGLNMAVNPWYMLQLSFTGWDFNMDGVESMNAVRAPANWAKYAGCHSLDQKKTVVGVGAQLDSGADLVRINSRLFAAWAESNGVVRVASGTVTPPDENGSCPGEDLINKQPCGVWSAPASIPSVMSAESVSVARDGATLVVAYRQTNGAVRVVRSTSIAANGTVSWGVPVLVAGVSTTTEPELGWVNYNDWNYGAISRLVLVYRDANNVVRRSQYSGSAWSAPAAMLTETGSTFTSGVSPTLAMTPAGEVCMAYTDSSQVAQMRCLNQDNSRWVAQPSLYSVLPTKHIGYTPGADATTRKIGLAWHTNRTSTGAPVDGDPYNGRFYLFVASTPLSSGLALVTNYHRWAFPVGSGLRFEERGLIGNWGDFPLAASNSGYSLYEDSELGALKGVYLAINARTNLLSQLVLPIADGSIDADLTSGNDYFILERQVCESIRANGFCGPASSSVHGL